MTTFDRAALVSTLTDARPALSSGGIIPELSHFWFDGKYVYAFDGGLGVRLALKSELECGIPGKMLFDLLKTSALKEIFIDVIKDEVVLQMGKSKTQLVMLDSDRLPWDFPQAAPKKAPSVVLSERIMEALHQVDFVRSSKPMQAVHHGVVVEPYDKHLELYTTDGGSIAQATVNERLSEEVPRFVIPWPFLDRLLELVEPGSNLYVLDDCLLAGGGDTLICSNLLELPEAPDLSKTVSANLSGAKPIALPTGLQPVLDRALILAGAETEAVLTFTIKGSSLLLQGKYELGSVSETLSLKSKLPEVSVKLDAKLVGRGLSHADSFYLSKKSLVLSGGEDFVYLVAAL